MMFSLDTETTGVNLRHGSAPYIVTMCDGDKDTADFYEWDIDPFTRQPIIPQEDLEALQKKLSEDVPKIFQNAKFDHRALSVIIPGYEPDWENTDDTVLGDHLLASSELHNLTSQAMRYLMLDIEPLEQAVKAAVLKAKKIIKSKCKKYGDWRIAKVGDPTMPSAKGELWKYDMWLPRAVAKAEGYKSNHPWWTVTSDYANGDSVVTMSIWKTMRKEIIKRGLWKLYQIRRKLLKISYEMETVGITYDRRRKDTLYKQYKQEYCKAQKRCIHLSDGHLDQVPKGATSNALKSTLFDHFKLKSNKLTKKAKQPSTDKDVIQHWLATLPTTSRAYHFISNLKDCRQRGTALGAMDGYDRFAVKTANAYIRRLFPSLNITGTDTLRGSSNDPNEQNISKKPGFNLRYLFGPAPGREWWSFDFENIELRIPAYEAGEEEMIRLFERPNDPPYFGSNHLLVSHILHPAKFEQCLRDGVSFKDRYKATLYQWVKNGNFAVQYGAMEESGTADRAYHVDGAQTRIKSRFERISALNEQMIAFAQAHGYVLTLPDKEIGKGYPLQCPRNYYGKIKPTVPLNYHVQGTAMWCTSRAMERTTEYLDHINSELGLRVYEDMERYLREGYYLGMQVHDELVFDFPRSTVLPDGTLSNARHAKHIRNLMKQSGDDIGVSLRVSASYHPENYSEEVDIAL